MFIYFEQSFEEATIKKKEMLPIIQKYVFYTYKIFICHKSGRRRFDVLCKWIKLYLGDI